VHTLALRVSDPETHFKSVLDQLTRDSTQDALQFLFPTDPIRLEPMAANS
jgi:hypothetical protein